jgi:DNA-binding NtrC family response regulator
MPPAAVERDMLPVNLPTIVICDDTSKLKQIENLIASRPELVFLASINRQAARQPLQPGIKVVWIELSPDPQRGLQLLGELKKSYPQMNFLVSYDEMKSDLVKTAMHLGAVEYLDAEGASKLLSEALKRIGNKVAQIDQAMASKPPLPLPNERAAALRSKVSQLERGYPSWFVPTVLLVVILMLGIIYYSLSR